MPVGAAMVVAVVPMAAVGRAMAAWGHPLDRL